MASQGRFRALRWFRSWWKHERRTLSVAMRARSLNVLLAVAVVVPAGLELHRRWGDQVALREQRLAQATQLMHAQLQMFKGVMDIWGRRDVSAAFARSDGSPDWQRQLQLPTGLSVLVSMAAVFDHQGQLLALPAGSRLGRQGMEALLRCAREQLPLSLQRRQGLALLCIDARERIWMAVMQGFVESRPPSSVLGVILLSAPLQHPGFGDELQTVMADLEAQLQIKPASTVVSAQQLQAPWGEPLRGPGRTLAFLQPRPLVPQVIASAIADLPFLLLLALLLMAVRIRLMLESRRVQLQEARRQRGVRQRLRRARQQLDRLCLEPCMVEREARGGVADLLDRLTRRLERYERAICSLSLMDAASGLLNRNAWLRRVACAQPSPPWGILLLHWPAAATLQRADLHVRVAGWTQVLPVDVDQACIGPDRFAWLWPAVLDPAALTQALESTLNGPWLLLQSTLPTGRADPEVWLQGQERRLHRLFAQGERGWQPRLQKPLPQAVGSSWLGSEWSTALQLGQLSTGALLISDRRQLVCGFVLIPLWLGSPVEGLDPVRQRRLAAEQGLASTLMLCLLREGLQAWRSLPLARREALTLTLPFDRHALNDPDLPGLILDLLEQSACAPSHLILSCRDEDLQACLEPLQLLRARGVAIQLVDCGFDSVNVLLHGDSFPFDGVLLSETLTMAIAFDQDADALVSAWMHLATSYGLQVTAEAVHSMEERERLVSLGIQRFQERFAASGDHGMVRALESC